MLNVVAIMGRLVADPELRTTTSGINMARFRIACDRNFARQGEQRRPISSTWLRGAARPILSASISRRAV